MRLFVASRGACGGDIGRVEGGEFSLELGDAVVELFLLGDGGISEV